jgi:GTP-binding protein HflX
MSQYKTEKAVFVGVVLEKGGERKVQEYLDELQFLAETAGAIGDKMFMQRMDRPDKATYIGTGKLQEIKDYCAENEIQYVIFDDELTGTQQRNIEKIIECSDVIDRTSLILEIFAQRAKTSYAKTQVELAHYQYMLPRLAGMWTHLERQRGGMGTRGGMGETQIEVDRRIVKQQIAKLKEELKKVDRQMATQRSNRGSLVRLALVGYTNVGKSTLMNLLAKSDVFAENKLFATLDTTVRKVVIENCPFLLSDTVGFIRKLPTQLVEAFKSTLDEVREADILVHVVDISHPEFEEQMQVVEQTLRDIGAANKPVYVVFNKVDAYTYEPYDEFSLTPKEDRIRTLDELKNRLDRAGKDSVHLHLRQGEDRHRKTQERPVQDGGGNPRRALSVQQFPMVKRALILLSALLLSAGAALAQNQAESAYATIFRGKLPGIYPYKFNGTYFWEQRSSSGAT